MPMSTDGSGFGYTAEIEAVVSEGGEILGSETDCTTYLSLAPPPFKQDQQVSTHPRYHISPVPSAFGLQRYSSNAKNSSPISKGIT